MRRKEKKIPFHSSLQSLSFNPLQSIYGCVILMESTLKRRRHVDHPQGNRTGGRRQHDHRLQCAQWKFQPCLRRHGRAYSGHYETIRLRAQSGRPFIGPAGIPRRCHHRSGFARRKHLPQPLYGGICGRADAGASAERLLSPDPLFRQLQGDRCGSAGMERGGRDLQRRVQPTPAHAEIPDRYPHRFHGLLRAYSRSQPCRHG